MRQRKDMTKPNFKNWLKQLRAIRFYTWTFFVVNPSTVGSSLIELIVTQTQIVENFDAYDLTKYFLQKLTSSRSPSSCAT